MVRAGKEQGDSTRCATSSTRRDTCREANLLVPTWFAPPVLQPERNSRGWAAPRLENSSGARRVEGEPP